jgi:hypothetical protein
LYVFLPMHDHDFFQNTKQFISTVGIFGKKGLFRISYPIVFRSFF